MEIISDIKDIDCSKWRAFVEKHPKGTIFQSSEMYEVYYGASHSMPMVIAVQENDEIRGVLLAVIMWNGNDIVKRFTARSIIVGGPLAENDNEQIIKQLFKAYFEKLPRYVVYSEIRPVYDMESVSAVFGKEGFKRRGHYNLVLEVDVDEQSLWAGLHKERQRNIRHAEKVGLEYEEVTSGSEIEKVLALIRQTYQRKKVPMSYFDVFAKAKNALNGSIHFFAAYNSEKMVAGQIRLCYKDLVYAWFAGSDEMYFKQRPNDFLMWKVICWAHENGYKWFDFGGGGEPGVPYGVRDYKLKYGCQMFDYGRFQYFHHPLVYKIGEMGAKMIIKR